MPVAPVNVNVADVLPHGPLGPVTIVGVPAGATVSIVQAEVAAAVRPDRLREKIARAARTDGAQDVMQAFKPIPFRTSPRRATEESLGPVGEELATGETQRGRSHREVGG